MSKELAKAETKKISIYDRTQAVSDVLFSSMGQGAIVIDEFGDIARVNEIALEILGYTRKDLLGKWYPETILAEDSDGNVIPTIERPVFEAFLSEKPIFKRVYFRKKDGERVAVALTVSPVILDDKPIGTIELFRDINHELKLEQAKDEFISIASHQLRTPATVVKQYLGMILGGFAQTKIAQNKMIATAYEHNERQLRIINDLLKVANADANNIDVFRKETDLVKLVKNIISSQKNDYKKKKMKLVFLSQLSSFNCSVDPLHIQMVIENLVTNAKKYSLEGSTVKVSIVVKEKHAEISVTDQGIGISAKDVTKLFKKFSRVQNPAHTVDGSGLGLYWAKKLVELHGGKIKVSSKLGVGSTFAVVLPRKKII